MKHPSSSRAAVRTLGLIAVVAGAVIASGSAQSPAPVIGSPAAGVREASGKWVPEHDLLVHPALRFIELHPTAQELSRIELLPRHTTGPVDDARYGLRSIDAYFDRTLAPEDERSNFSADGTLRLVLVTRSDAARRFWRLESAADGPDPAKDLRMDPLSISDEPDEQERIVTATDDPSVPLLDIQYGSGRFGGSGGITLARHLLVDLRGPIPRVIAVLDDVELSGGGACGAHDAIYGTRREFGCQWNAARRDFRCAETLHRFDTDWGERRGSRFFLLDSGAAVPYPADAPRTLQAFAERAVSGQQTASAMLERYGTAAVIETISFGGATVVLIGTPLLTEALTEVFGARFHVAIARPGEQTIVEELAPRTRLDAGLPAHPDGLYIHAHAGAQKPSETFTPDGGPPAFQSRVVFETDRQKVLRVTMTEGDGRGVYLVGLEYTDSRLTGDALLVATQAPVYSGCQTWILPTTAVAMDIATNPFAALLDVEPAALEKLDRKNDQWAIAQQRQPDCPAKAEVTWRAGAGFEVKQQAVACGPSRAPRRVSIDHDGRMTSSTARLVQRPRR